MGNQLAGIAPSQIFPVEHYLTDQAEYKYDSNLGSTRFFKVARAKHREGLAVVKVFAIHDPSLPLRTHKERVEAHRNTLINVPNCLPFQKAMLTEKAGILVRQYVKDNLYDRLSTRPFLNNIEKRWIAFQLLSTLAQCHKLGVCHGDIKLENVMVTSWNWVLLTDFASFKPTYLPEDNPADFSYFFDTSRRRTCYIAPERFVKTRNPNVVQSSSSNSLLLPEDEIKKGDLSPAMDIFSLGCTLVEVFTEGNSPFDFSQLLAYRSGEYSPWKILEKIDDLNIRDLVRHMIQRDPNSRQTAEEYLEQQRNLAFPEYFYTFLKEFVQGFSFVPILAPDDKVTRLKRDVKNIINILQASPSPVEPPSPSSVCSSYGNSKEGLVIIVSLVTSCLRSLKHCSAKLQALEILREMAPHLNPEIILDRLLPYMLFLLHDCYPRVRMAAIETLTDCLSMVHSVPRSDANIFPEYIIPNLAHVAQDESVIVRIAFAQNIAVIAETALKFLELTQLETSDPNDKTSDLGHSAHTQASYDSELQILQEMIQECVSTLLSDPDNNVKQMLLDQGVTRLCVFFGRQKANDVLLSHMITFLNDKEDRNLRRVFFECIVGVAAYVGWQCCPILKPLLQQGMADPEEFVISKTLTALADLTELGLVQKTILYDLVGEAVPLLCHPNLWVRHGTVGFICALARTLNLADVQCKLAPLLQPFLSQPVIQFDKEVILLNAIGVPLSREQYEYLVKLPFLPAFLDDLQERLLSKSIVRTSHRMPVETDSSLQAVYWRLQSDGMNDSTERKILALSDHLLKIHKHRLSISEPRGLGKEQNRVIDLGNLNLVIPLHFSDITATVTQKEQSLGSQSKKLSHKKAASIESPTVTMNEEWQHMFGSIDSQSKMSAEGSMNQSVNSQADDPCDIVLEGTDVVQELLPPPRNVTEKTGSPAFSKQSDYCYVPCLNELQAMNIKKQNEYLCDQQMKEVSELDFKDKLHGSQASEKFKPKGILVAHLHEHKQAVNRLLAIPETSLFATCSNDKTIKVWDCGRMETRSITNRSRQTYSRMEGQVTCLSVCQSLESLAAAADNGSIHVFRIESNSPKSVVLCTRTLEPNEEGCVVDMTYFDAGPQTILVYATVFGSIVGWDLRAPGTAWKLESQAKNGLITSFCVDRYHSWMVAGTASGKIICWDMRFQLPITTVTHPTSARIRRLLINPHDQSTVLASVQGNNEVSLWDMETSARRKTLWASSAPPLSQAQASSHSIYCMQLTSQAGGTTLLTGGSDMRIRSWDLVDPTESYIVAGAANDPVSQNAVTYSSRLIDGTEVIQEMFNRPRTTPNEDHPQRYPDVPPSGHHDIISDIAFVQTSQKFQKFLVSASRDGIIKVWK